jgi:TPR repeat protein
LPLINGFVEAQAIRCSWGLAEPCRFTGEAYHLGMGVAQDAKAAARYFERACSLGSTDGCVMSALMVVERGDRAHFGDVLTSWEQACENGSYLGCARAGVTLALDPLALGTPRDIPRGRMLLAKACAARFMPACGTGAALVVELKQTSEYAAAHEQLLGACRLHERESCAYLAARELDGTFGTKDEQAARTHFLQSCNDDWGAACWGLAYMWAKGIGAAVNLDNAKRLASRACVLRYQPACDMLRYPERELPPP